MKVLKLIYDYGGFNGKTVFQKFIWFLKSENIRNFDYFFIKYIFGPYSPKLEADLDFLIKENLIRIKKQNGKEIIEPLRNNISNYFEENNFNFNSNNLRDLAESNIQKLFEYELRNLHRIELATTMHYLIKTEEIILKDIIFKDIELWPGKEGKFTNEEKLDIWDILESNKLIDKKIIQVNQFYEKFSELNNGKPDAYKFQNHIKKVLKYLFPDQLDSFEVEDKLNFSRKRTDITAYNKSQKGFFFDLQKNHNIKCPYIIFECKNSSFDLENREYAQIGFQLSDDIGYFGILVCRQINDKVSALNHLRDILVNNSLSKKHIIILEDSDFKEMLRLKLQGENPDRILREKLKQLLFNQPKG